MATIDTLPEDAFLEVLLRLPVKSLVRLRCVSKSWFALLKSPNFIDMHLKFSHARDGENLLITRFLKKKKKNLLSVHSNDESISVLVPNLQLEGYGDESLSFVGSSDGIICVCTSRDIILFNPAIRETRTLPRLTCPDGCHILRAGMGFGFDPVSNDYKVVQIVAIDHGEYPFSYGAKIYNLRTDTWRELDVVLPRVKSFLCETFDLLFNGKIHWPASNDSEAFILTMDMSTEEFHELRYPNYLDKTTMDEDAGDIKNLFVMKNSLALILYTSKYPRDHPYEQMIHVWVMEEYGIEESWSKKYCIGPLCGILRLLSVWKNEKILIEKVWKRRGEEDRYGYDCELVAWDALRNEEVQKFDVYGFQYTLGVVVYKETLLSIANT